MRRQFVHGGESYCMRTSRTEDEVEYDLSRSVLGFSYRAHCLVPGNDPTNKHLHSPHWTAPYLDVCLQTPASRVFQSAFASLATTAALSTALRNIQALPESLEYTTGAGDVFNGTFDRISRGLWDLVDYGKPLLFAGAPLPLVLFVTRKDQGSCSNERK